MHHETDDVCRDIDQNGDAAIGGRLHCLTIIGQIEGHVELGGQTKTTKYEHILPLLTAIEESSDTDGLLILLNTVGGDVEAGLAIAELISGMSKPTVSLVLGGGHSIGVPLAVSARRSFIAPTASMTLHPVRMSGTVMAIPQTMEYFRKIEERDKARRSARPHATHRPAARRRRVGGIRQRGRRAWALRRRRLSAGCPRMSAADGKGGAG